MKRGSKVAAVVKRVGKRAMPCELVRGAESHRVAIDSLVGGSFEVYPAAQFGGPDGLDVYVHAYGLMGRLLANVCGIVGDFVVTGGCDEDGELQPLTADQSAAAVTWLTEAESDPAANLERMREYDQEM